MYFERVSSPRKTFGEYNGHECGVSELLSIQLYHVKFNNNRSNYSEKKSRSSKRSVPRLRVDYVSWKIHEVKFRF